MCSQQLVDGEYYWIACTAKTDWHYSYTGKDIAVMVRSVTDPDGTELTAGIDYTYSPTTVKEYGTYNVIIAGLGKYSSKMTFPFMVGNRRDEGHLSTGVYTVHEDLTTYERIGVYGNAVVNIPEGVTLDGDITITGCAFNGLMTGGETAKGALLGWSDHGGKKSVSDCLYLVADGQDTKNLDFVKGYSTVAVTNCYKTVITKSGDSQAKRSQKARRANRADDDYDITDLEEYGIWANVYDVKPDYFGELVTDYGFLKVYEGGLQYEDQYYVASISLADDADNSAVIALADEYVADVTLSDYTLYRDGRWHTLCLPFNLAKIEGTPLEGAKEPQAGMPSTASASQASRQRRGSISIMVKRQLSSS